MSWDFDLEEEDCTFLSNSIYGDIGDPFYSGPSSNLEPQPSGLDVYVPDSGILQEPKAKIQPNVDMTLVEENNRLKEFCLSLKAKAEQVEIVNQKLKGQLEDCRNWFKQAMFSGFTNSKK